MKLRSSRSLSATLAIAFFTLSVVILLFNGGLALLASIQNNQDAISSKQQLIAQEAAGTVRSFIEEKFSSMETAVTFTDLVSTTDESRKTVMQSILGLDPAFRQFAVLDKRGRQLAEISRLSPMLSSQFLNQLESGVLDANSNGLRFISNVYIDDSTSEPLIAIGIPVKNVFGDYEGSLVAEVNLKFMWELVDQLKVGESGYAYVVDQQGNLLAFSDTGRVLMGENVSHMEAVARYIQNPTSSGEASVSTYTGIGGQRVVGTYAALGSPDWAVVTELPWAEAYRGVFQVAAFSVAIILALAILAAVTGVIVARRLAVPLVNLKETATRIAAGEMQLQAAQGGAQEIDALAQAFNSMTSQLRESIQTLEQRIAERTLDLETSQQQSEKRAAEFQTVGEISSIITGEQKVEILLPLICQVVSDRFLFYHVGIFLLDENTQFAVLRATNSEGGRKMLERGHRLEVGQTGIVGYVANTGEPRIALDVGADSVFFNNPDLSATRSEMALPLRARGLIIGVLDVQSTKSGAFSQSDVGTLAILADQIAIAIENARLFGEGQAALTEVQSLYAQYLNQEWSSFAQKGTKIGYHQSLIEGKELLVPIESAEISEVLKTGQLAIHNPEDGEADGAIIMPVKLRGQVIGVLNIKTLAKGRRWSDDEINMIRVISERLALALENARLFEETTRTAEREKLVSDITTSIRSTNDPQTMIDMAVSELRRALGVSRVEIIPQRVTSTGTEL